MVPKDCQGPNEKQACFGGQGLLKYVRNPQKQ